MNHELTLQESSDRIVRKAIVDLYLNVKIRSQEEIQAMSDDLMEREKEKLAKVDTLDIIDYVKHSVEILMHMRIDEFELFKESWNNQEKLRKAQIAQEKQRLKDEILKLPEDKKKKSRETKLFERVKYELLSNQSSLASLSQFDASPAAAGYTGGPQTGNNSSNQQQ